MRQSWVIFLRLDSVLFSPQSAFRFSFRQETKFRLGLPVCLLPCRWVNAGCRNTPSLLCPWRRPLPVWWSHSVLGGENTRGWWLFWAVIICWADWFGTITWNLHVTTCMVVNHHKPSNLTNEVTFRTQTWDLRRRRKDSIFILAYWLPQANSYALRTVMHVNVCNIRFLIPKRCVLWANVLMCVVGQCTDTFSPIIYQVWRNMAILDQTDFHFWSVGIPVIWVCKVIDFHPLLFRFEDASQAYIRLIAIYEVRIHVCWIISCIWTAWIETLQKNSGSKITVFGMYVSWNILLNFSFHLVTDWCFMPCQPPWLP